jgi:hypothetical protein
VIAAILLTVALGAKPDAYDTYQQALAQGKSVVVLVGSKTCVPCRAVEREFVLNLRARGVVVQVDVNDAKFAKHIHKWAKGSVRVPMLIVVKVVKPKHGKPSHQEHIRIGYEHIKAYVHEKR